MIKAGKSILIKDHASISVIPETVVLTKFKYSKDYKMKISFYNLNKWKELWQSAIKSKGLLGEYEKLNAKSQKDSWVGKESIGENLSKEGLKNTFLHNLWCIICKRS